MNIGKLITFLILGCLVLFCFSFIGTLFSIMVSIIHLVVNFALALVSILFSKPVIAVLLITGFIIWLVNRKDRRSFRY